ncbi:MAG: hypothetical protein Q8S20_15400 [Sulfuritalea sp.]|nr:hypothetical protein [Sulfuritalea sp.]
MQTINEALQQRISIGEQLRDSGSLDEALLVFTDVTAEFQSLALGHYKCATVLVLLDRSADAELAYRLALELQPIYSEAANNLGVLRLKRRDWVEAETLFYRALAENPNYFQAHLNIADVLHQAGRHEHGLYHARRAFELSPTSPVAIERLGVILRSLGRTHEAAEFLAAHITPETNYAPLWSTYAVTLQGLGRQEEADRAHTEAERFAGTEFLPRMNRLYCSNYLQVSAEVLWQRHRAFGEWAREVVGSPASAFPAISPEADRRLRVGFVSGDFRKHSVAYFLPGVLGHLDKSRLQVIAYNVSNYVDDVTRNLKPIFNIWRDVAQLDHKELYEKIRQDRIDILIDLSGFTNENRLMVFARRAAPVQVTYLGYPNTTGLDVIDYRLTDNIADPTGAADAYHSETLWRLDRCFLCYTAPEAAPPVVVRSPASEGVVFGSYNNRAKYSAECLATWGRLLLRVPGSCLVIKSLAGNGDDAGRKELVDRFVAMGVAPERIEVKGSIPDTRDHLDSYSRIDIALDSFPYNGTTTTCEALWMGVPVVTLAGDRHSSRVGASILEALDLQNLIADSVDQYIEIAASLASDSARRQELRATMRTRMLASKLCDSRNMGRELTQAFRQMWYRYCDKALPASQEETGNQAQAESNIRLHIGGTVAKEGWHILNIEPGEGVDFVADIRELSVFDDGCCSEIYVSHVLEHVTQAEVLPVLNELYRMLSAGGKLYLSVPDLETLSSLLLNPSLDMAEKFQVMRMLFGAQTTPSDFHQIGFTFEFLVDYLRDVGFESVEHVESFGLFNDMSDFVFAGQLISLNLIVTK